MTKPRLQRLPAFSQCSGGGAEAWLRQERCPAPAAAVSSTASAQPANLSPVSGASRRGIKDNWIVTLASIAVLACGGRMDAETLPNSLIPSMTREELVPRIQSAICDSAGACCTKAGLPHHADCAKAAHRQWQPMVDHANAVGADFDASQAARCVEQIGFEWSLCADQKTFTSTSRDVCAKVFLAPSPQSMPGQPCEASLDCIRDDGPTLLCVEVYTGTMLEKTCMRHFSSDAGGQCGGAMGDYIADCKAPNFCSDDYRCHLRFSLGDSCSLLGGDSCGAGSVCVGDDVGLCRPVTPAGEPCTSASLCEQSSCAFGTCPVKPDTNLLLSLYCG